MAKHPHMIQLLEGRTWKCMLDGCSFFVHMGLAHVMVGKKTMCFECRQVFIMTQSALNAAKMISPEETAYVKCDECLDNEFTAHLTSVLKGSAVTEVVDDTPKLHANNCPAWLGDSCNCGIGDKE